MKVDQILETIKYTRGTKDKMSILRCNESPEIQKSLKYALDGFINFHVVKVPGVKSADRSVKGSDRDQWGRFFESADRCSRREVTGNAAIDLLHRVFCSVDPGAEKWMRNVLKKRFSIGLATKSINKVFPELIETFEVQLAEKMTDKIMKKLPNLIRVEPKLDGIRCLAIVRDGSCEIFARSGKQITNFDKTIGLELSTLHDGVYDGEIMDEDFVALMRKVHRKKEVDVTSSYLALFDTVSLEEWDIRLGEEVLSSRRDRLEAIFREKSFQFLRLVEQVECDKTDSEIDLYHRQFVKRGYEGAMVKNPGLPYSFGRSDAVIKVKSFFDVDLTVVGFKEGSGRHIGKLGSVLVDFEEVEVYVGSGFDDEMRDEVWKNQSVYLGMTAEVRYQEVTPDGSLRFPTFVCWRTDK